MQHNIQEGTVYFHPAVVLSETQLLAIFPIVQQLQEDPRQPFFGRFEEIINQIRLYTRMHDSR